MAPSAKQTEEPQWPPRSPREALLGTAGGRERYKLLANSTSPPLSPLRHSRTASALSTRNTNAMAELEPEANDDDEETLQLKLQEIQAQLKLKRLQNARPQKGDVTRPESTSRPESASLSGRVPRPESKNTRPVSQKAVEIPASPVRKSQPEPVPQTSPSRVMLGIDKGLKAKDISLRRAPSLQKSEELQDNQRGPQQKFGGYLKRSKTPSSGAAVQQQQQQSQTSDPARPPTFNERLAAARTDEADRLEKRERVQKSRTTAFGIGQQEIDEYKSKAVDLPEQPEAPVPQFSRQDILGTSGDSKPQDGLQPSNTVPSRRTQQQQVEADDTFEPPAPKRTHAKKTAPDDVPEAEASAFEPYSSLHLSRRIVPHAVLTRHFAGKKILNMKDLLKHVKAPDFELPDYEQDIIVFAIIAKRSEPRAHQPRPDTNGAQQQDRGKYMVITLADLQHEMELFLFDSGFERFWKMSEGTVIALLNPTIMPPPRGREATGRFSLVVNSDGDTIIEVGTARDLGFCKSIRKDGSTCNHWVNRKRTEFCEFHTNEAIRRKRSARVELSGADFGRRKHNSHEVHLESKAEKRQGQYDRETQSHWFATKSFSSSDLIDGASKLADKREREEELKRRLAAKERERGIMQRLSKVGDGAGKEYMKRVDDQRGAGGAGPAGTSSPRNPFVDGTTSSPAQASNASAPSLLAPRGKDHKIHLGPVKRKRPESAASGSTISSSSAAAKGGTGSLGWGGSLKDKLSRMKEGEKLWPGSAVAGDADADADAAGRPPVRKKTRFVTEKGIREAGRESLGDVLPGEGSNGKAKVQGMGDYDDYDDDDLVILM